MAEEVPAAQNYSPKPVDDEGDEKPEAETEDAKDDKKKDKDKLEDELPAKKKPAAKIETPKKEKKGKDQKEKDADKKKNKREETPLKRPASALPSSSSKAAKKNVSWDDEDEDDEPPVLKKPAAKNIQKNKKTASMKRPAMSKEETPAPKKQGQAGKLQMAEEEKTKEEKNEDQEEGEEEHPREEDPMDDEDNETRDRSKSVRFFNMMRKSELFQAVLEAWQASDSRMKQTRLINGLFVKQGKNYVINSKFELPTKYEKNRETSRTDKAMDAQSGYGKTIFMKMMNLTWEELENCLKTGEVRSFESGGVALYAAVNVVNESSVAKTTTERLGMEEVEMDAAASKAFLKVFENVEPEVQLDNPSSSGRKTKALEGPQGQFLGQKSSFIRKVLRFLSMIRNCASHDPQAVRRKHGGNSLTIKSYLLRLNMSFSL